MYQVRVQISRQKEAEWCVWMQKTHIPEVLATGCFLSARMGKFVEEGTENPPKEGFSAYLIQYVLENAKKLAQYREKYAPNLMKAHTERYEGHFFAQRSVLQILAEGLL